MRIESRSIWPVGAMASAMKVQHRASLTRQVLGTFGMLDPHLGKALAMVESESREVMRGASEIAQARLSGSIVDLVA